MSKDVKIGVGVGAALALIVILYFVFHAKSKAPTETADQRQASNVPVRKPNTPIESPVTPPATAQPTGLSEPIIPRLPEPATQPIGVATPLAGDADIHTPAVPVAQVGPSDPLAVHLPTASTTRPATLAPVPLTPPIPAPPAAGKTYTVKQNDNLWSIAHSQLGRGEYWYLIRDANPNVDPNHLRVGQVIKIPAASAAATSRPAGQPAAGAAAAASPAVSASPAAGQRVHTVVAGDSLWTIAEHYYGDGRQNAAILKANPGLDANRLKIGQQIVLPAIAGAKPASAAPAARPAKPAATATASTKPSEPSDRPYFEEY